MALELGVPARLFVWLGVPVWLELRVPVREMLLVAVWPELSVPVWHWRCVCWLALHACTRGGGAGRAPGR